MKVAMKQLYVMKEVIIKGLNPKNVQNFILVYEWMNKNQHINVLKGNGAFIKNKNTLLYLIVEYCPMNLAKVIENKIF